jgi:alkanesulfonate monooxygenase SsuD/methylene tetrahydromethanopterin reductase-like flavin-dependent oxidoreductase (luciferase family)
MKFGIFYEHQLPRPWAEGAEQRLFQDALDQVELADRLGIDHAWEVEHHFLEEYSHSSAPEVFLAAASQRTKRIRLGHGIVLMPPGYNPPARIAERIATLDLVSNGRVDWGTGESASRAELEGFGIEADERRAMWRETVEQVANMMVMDPYPGFQGKYFSMPVRNVVPKPVQKPHPPLYQVCVSKDGIENTALRGWPMLNSVLFGPVEQLIGNRDTYVDTLKKAGRGTDEIAGLLGRWGVSRQIYVADTDARALAETKDAELWYQESFRKFVIPERIDEAHPTLQPGFRAMADRLSKVTWEGLVKETLAFGSPDTVARHIETMRQLGVGQVMCWMNFGGLPQDKIRRSMELFAREVMPRFR